MKQIDELRSLMREHNVSALIVPGTDPHAGEYIAAHWQEREFITGFTGSAGTAVVTLDGGWMWTDSRYFLQAEEQLKASGLMLQKEGVEGTPSIVDQLLQTLNEGDIVAINPEMISINAFADLKASLEQRNISILTAIDFIDAVWHNRPAMPEKEAMLFDEKHCGETTSNKLARLREKIAAAHADAVLLTALDDIAWLMNIRGTDIDYNPVVIAYAVVQADSATLFINPEKLNDELNAHFKRASITLLPYTEVKHFIAQLHDCTLMLDPQKCNYALYEAIAADVKIVNCASPITAMKAIKNSVELKSINDAMRFDGVALTRFFMKLEKAMKKGERVTELDCVNWLHDFRAAQPGFITESFATIAAYAEHGAIVHYEPEPATDATLKPENFLLLDSGGQYLTGTTDITRTVALGKITPEMRRDYTLVLKGHLALGHQLFPTGTRGTQLDAIARQFLWNNELQFGHGTGHGVGFFLNVHEGPHGIRMNDIPVTLVPGMIVSNEPGLYRAGSHGVRIENLVAVSEYPNNINQFGHFLHFRALTLFPYDRHSIEIPLLTPDELLQINSYHQYVYAQLSPLLDQDERAWLKEKTALI